MDIGEIDASLERELRELYARRTCGIKPGLAPIQDVLAELGNPQREMAAVHVAGTNGKGSVCAMVAAMLHPLGLRVGLYTSPHITSFAERIQIDGRLAGRELLRSALDQVLEAEQRASRELTFFECATAMAFVAFRDQGVRLAVVETGLGGRLDATNVLTPLVCAMTRIGRDHAQWLGDTLEEVAAEKAGIMKPGIPVVCGPQEDVVARVLAETAQRRGSPLVWAAETTSVRRLSADLSGQLLELSTENASYGRVNIPLPGHWQLENLPVALTAFELFCRSLGVEPPRQVVRQGLRAVRWPGRMELVAQAPSTVADAAHNPLGARELVRGLKACGVRRAVWVVGTCADKDVAGILQALHALPGPMRTVPIGNERGLPPGELARSAARCGFAAEACADLPSALAWARTQADPNDAACAVVICGSLFLLEHLYAALGQPPFEAG